MKPIPTLSQNFIKFLESKINNGTNASILFKYLDTLFNYAENDKDIKTIILPYMENDIIMNKLSIYFDKQCSDKKEIFEKVKRTYSLLKQ